MKALVLPGGGSNGDWQAGRLSSLYESGYAPDLIVGTSVGALNGAIAATGQVKELRDIWTNLSERKVLKKRRNVRLGLNYVMHKIGVSKPKLAVWSNNPLRTLLEKHLLNKKVLVEYRCAVVVVGNDSPNTYMKYQIHAGEKIRQYDIDFILASTAIPVIFDPVFINDELYVDGGVMQSSPIRQTIREFPITEMTAIACQPIDQMSVERPGDIIEMSGWTVNAILRNQFLQEWQEMDRWNQATEQAELVIDGRVVRHIKQNTYFPKYDLGNSLDFSNEKTAVNFNNGYNSKQA